MVNSTYSTQEHTFSLHIVILGHLFPKSQIDNLIKNEEKRRNYKNK